MFGDLGRGSAVAIAPYERLVWRIFQGPGTVASIAEDREVLCPAQTTATVPPVYLDGQLERITGGTGHIPLSDEIESMLTPHYTHAPTIAYHLRKAVLHDGSIYVKSMRHFIAERTGRKAPAHYIRKAGLASSAVGYTYFGHWLRDDCCQYLLAEKAGQPICLLQPTKFEHRQSYAARLQQQWAPVDYAVIDELTIYQDFAQNSLKRERYGILFDRLAKAFSGPAVRDRLIYLRRGSTGIARLVKDEPELIEILVRKGFEVLDVTAPVDQIVPTLRRAKLVVSMEGSHIAHCTYSLEQGCGLVLLQPADRFTAVHRHWTECVGIRLGFVVGRADAGGYAFDAEEILKTVDLMAELL